MNEIYKKYPAAIFLAVISAFSIEAAVHIYKKNKNDLEPIYIFELNTIASIAVFTLWSAYTLLEIPVLCSIRNGLAYYFRLNIFVGILVSQVDRFFALYWHAEYRERVTPQLAMVSSKFDEKNFTFALVLSSF